MSKSFQPILLIRKENASVLKSVSPLGEYSAEFNTVTIAEVTGLSLISIAVPNGGQAALKSALKKQLKMELPEPGHVSISKPDNSMLIWTAPDQFLLAFDAEDGEPVKSAKSVLGAVAYLTDQSDAWVKLEISGSRRLEALERICPINLHPDIFQVGKAARTMMEHLGVLIIRDTTDSFLLLSARSTAKSFLHAVETSAKNIS
jgi:sarcosine oxidase subunit gamma